MGRTAKLTCETKLFYPGTECTHYPKTDNQVTKDGFYTTKHDKPPRPRFYGHGGKPRCSDTRYSDLFNLGGSLKEDEQVAKLSSPALGCETIAEVLNHAPRTIDNWLSAIGKNSEQFHLVICLTIKLKLMFLQLDKLWSYCLAKYHKLWVFIGFDASAQVWINFELGSRTPCTAYRLVKQIRDVGDSSQKRVLRLTTDKFSASSRVRAEVFFAIPYRYLPIVTRRVNKKLATVNKVFVKGTSRAFPQNAPKTQNTSSLASAF